MANNNTHFSEMLTGVTKEEADWVCVLAKALRDYEDEPSPGDIGVEAKRILDSVGSNSYSVTCEVQASSISGELSVWLHDDAGSSDPFIAGQLVQSLFRRFNHTDRRFVIQFAEVCDKPRVGEFGGGIIAVTAESVSVMTTGELADFFYDNHALPELDQ
jgi:hypothetical protein